MSKRLTHYCASGTVGQLEAEWDADSEEYRSLGKCPDCDSYVYGDAEGIEHS